jgi:DNA-binding transcriptional MerR regulator
VDERPYLSIGDVLALLQREFPDVTISKIRFLESRGLLVPDRTPSGYRKFYEHDVERLRWILRQQREHFLPLKVIKGRLEGQEPPRPPALFEMGEQAPLSASGHAGQHTGQNGIEGPAGSPLLASVPSRATANGTAAEGARQGGPATPPAAAGGAAARVSSVQAHPAEAAERHRPPPQSPAGAPSDERTVSGSEFGGSRDKDPGPDPEATASRPQPAEPNGEMPAAAGTSSGPSSKDVDPAPTGKPRAERVPLSSGGAANEVAALVGVSLTAAELAQASGLETQQVGELESYGLIEGRMVAGVRCYDEAALVVAGLAASFARFGVEARHLRVFKYAAERQTGLYSQIVLPLLRQRNPDARRRALEDVNQLSELGASLQASFAKAALRDLTGA